MIIKSLSRKGAPSFGQVIDYINKPNGKSRDAIVHNLLCTPDEHRLVEKEFLENARYGSHSKNRVILYHEILSFSPEDSDRLTPAIITDLTRKYLKLRASNALAYAKPHYDKDNIHVHILISGNQIKSRRQLRLTRAQFNRIKIGIERYQQDRYPFLRASIVFGEDRGKDKAIKTRSEREMERRKAGTHKQAMEEIIREILIESYSEAGFIENLKGRGLEFYQRGLSKGVRNIATGRKYRLKTLGLDKMYVETESRWEIASERSRGIKQIAMAKAKALWNKMRFKQELLSIIEPEQKGRAGELQRVLRRKQRQERAFKNRTL